MIPYPRMFDALYRICFVPIDALKYPFVDVYMQFQECDPEKSYDIPFYIVDMLMIRNVKAIPMRLQIPSTLIGEHNFVNRFVVQTDQILLFRIK